jgi:hypothetical protein
MATIDRFPQYDFFAEGYVVSRVNRTPKVLKPIKMGQYVGLQILRSDGHTEKAYLHRLICEAFHGPCPDGMECRHLDGNRKNNSASNLSWGTKLENEADRKSHGNTAAGEANPMAKLTRKRVEEMKKYRAVTGDSYRIIGNKFGVSTMTAYRAVTGQSWRQ